MEPRPLQPQPTTTEPRPLSKEPRPPAKEPCPLQPRLCTLPPQGILKKIGCCYSCVQTGKSRLTFLPLSALSSAH